MREKSAFFKIVMIVILVILVGNAAFIVFHQKTHQPLPVAKTIDTSNQPTIGSDTAKLHMVVFEDLKCGNCARYSNEIFPKIKKRYIDTGIAKYTMINLAFLPNSMPAANAARCVYAQKPALFFPYVDAIFANQPPENEDWATIPQLSDFAAGIKGINMNQFTNCLVQTPYTTVIDNNLKIALDVMGEQIATPTLYVNGVLVRPITMDNISKTVEALQ